MIKNLYDEISKIPLLTYFVGSILFLSIVGVISLFGYSLTIIQKKLNESIDDEIVEYSLSPIISNFFKGIIFLGILILLLLPAGIIYAIIPILLNIINIELLFGGGGLIIILAIIGISLSLIGFYLLSGVLFSYVYYIENQNQSITMILKIILKRKIFTVVYLKSVLKLFVLSILFAGLIALTSSNVIFLFFIAPISVIYFVLVGVIISEI